MNFQTQNKIFQTLESLIQMHTNIFVYHHVYPDGDCLGSQLGLVKLLQFNFPNKNIYAIGDAENLFPFLKKELYELSSIPKEHLINSMAIIVDGDSKNRVKFSSDFYPDKIYNQIIRIDHHDTKSNIPYDYEWVDATYCAVAEQITEMAKSLNWKVNAEIANFLYLGISSDSGRFRFEKVQPRTYKLVGWLGDHGLDFNWMNYHLSVVSEKFLKFQAHVLTHAVRDGKFIYYHVKKSDIQTFDLNIEQRNDANILANIDDYIIWAFFIELDNGFVRIRLRSNTISIEKALVPFGASGGHHFSTALSFKKDKLPEIISGIKDWIQQYEPISKN